MEDQRFKPVMEDGSPDVGRPVTVDYRNWRGVRELRQISPVLVWYGSTEFHAAPGWLLHVYDWGKLDWRDYALADCNFTETKMTNETQIEQELQSKGLNAPRLTPDMIDASIAGEDYHVFPGTTLTVCCLTLRNGFTVTGESAAASPENFDQEIGRKISRENARQKIWALEGYLLRDRLAAK